MQLTSLVVVAALALCAAAGAPAAFGAQACPNEQLRSENNSTALPDCRAYELTTPDANHAAFSAGLRQAARDGNALVYSAFDAPDNAESGIAISNFIRAQRDPVEGWRDVSFAPPLPEPAGVFQGNRMEGYSEDLSSAEVTSDQPLAGPTTPPGQNAFVERSDGSFTLVSRVGAPFEPLLKTYPAGPIFLGGTPDYGHVYFAFGASQLSPDPGGEGQIYSFSQAGGLQLLSFLPGGELAPGGGALATGLLKPQSADGKYVAFVAGNEMYLRVNESESIDIAPIAINRFDPNSDQAGVSSDGETLLFTDRAQLAPGANTGTGETGRDLYSYDIASHQLADLTPDTAPADAATGANVLQVVGSTADGAYIYFTATGNLAEGARSGTPSLYVYHDGHTAFISDAEGLTAFHVTADAQYLAFDSTSRLTGYDNQGHTEVYESIAGSPALTCVSCRPDATSPTGDSELATGRSVSTDGAVFFQSTDAVLPGMPGGVAHVFEYAHAAISPISPLAGAGFAKFVDASVSGDDVFFETFEGLVPNPNEGDPAIYDARVDGGFPVKRTSTCEGAACQGEQAGPPPLPAPSTSAFSGPGNLSAPPATPAKTAPKPLTRAQKLARALRACARKPARRRPRCRAQARKHGPKAPRRKAAAHGKGR